MKKTNTATKTKPIEAKKSRIPELSSYDEEAEFWDNHSITEFLDELQPVEWKPSPSRLTEGLTVRLDTSTLSRLRIAADEKGMGPTTLIRMWIREKLREGDQALIERFRAEGKLIKPKD